MVPAGICPLGRHGGGDALFALETGEPITDFDIVAFSVGYEMAFTSILNMLDLADIPLHSADRTGLTPLVIAGGTAMYNPEPIADFIDKPGEKAGAKRTSFAGRPRCRGCMCPACMMWNITPTAP